LLSISSRNNEDVNEDVNDDDEEDNGDDDDGNIFINMIVATTTPLHNRWTLWYDNPRLAPPGTDWHDQLKNLGTFQTAEEFWSIFNNVKPSGELSVNSNYHLFKEGVEPMWEDPANKEGGKFVLTIPKKDSKGGKCDEWWLFTVLALIGETMDASGEEICGCVVSIRKGFDRIALWLKSCDRKACTEVGARWKKCLEVSNKTSLVYQAHMDAAASGSSFKNEVKFAV
jgi:translation initiation factor 4E